MCMGVRGTAGSVPGTGRPVWALLQLEAGSLGPAQASPGLLGSLVVSFPPSLSLCLGRSLSLCVSLSISVSDFFLSTGSHSPLLSKAVLCLLFPDVSQLSSASL